jgi:exonuclease III
MQNKPLDVITLNETRVDDSVLNGEVEIPGYDIVRRDRNRNGGGVGIYIRNNIPFTIRKYLMPDIL